MAKYNLGALCRNNNSFAFDLYNQLRHVEGNLFFSPFSISTALAMTYAGARGETESQMRSTLHFDLGQRHLHEAFAGLRGKIGEAESTGGIQLKVANSLWPHVDYPFLDAFISMIKKFYGVEITALDYAGNPEEARLTINDWVAERTQNKIKDLIVPGLLNTLTRLVLANAIYFKGNWAVQFDPHMTGEEDFWTPQKPVRVQMMKRKGEYLNASTGDIQILELPYMGDRLSMLVLLPHEKDGLPALEDKLTSGLVAKSTKYMQHDEITVHLPKFKTESCFLLNSALSALGMTDAFTEPKADFSGMDGTRLLHIAYAIHKAFIEVNEEGTEAAAATAIVMKLRGIPDKPPEFRADHPFIFIIRERETGSILFMGRITTPRMEFQNGK